MKDSLGKRVLWILNLWHCSGPFRSSIPQQKSIFRWSKKAQNGTTADTGDWFLENGLACSDGCSVGLFSEGQGCFCFILDLTVISRDWRKRKLVGRGSSVFISPHFLQRLFILHFFGVRASWILIGDLAEQFLVLVLPLTPALFSKANYPEEGGCGI